MGYCVRTALKIPRGERYELCRSVHAEANAIISASRDQMLGSTLFLTGVEVPGGSYVKDADCCSMCRRLIINAGIAKVICRTGPDTYTVTDVQEWIEEDDTLPAGTE